MHKMTMLSWSSNYQIIRTALHQKNAKNAWHRASITDRYRQPGPFPIARVGDLGPNETSRSPGVGRPPFWERPNRALPDPEKAPASGASKPPLADVKSHRL